MLTAMAGGKRGRERGMVIVRVRSFTSVRLRRANLCGGLGDPRVDRSVRGAHESGHRAASCWLVLTAWVILTAGMDVGGDQE